MTPIKTPDCNFTYTAPPSMPECLDLPCLVHERGTTSFWQLDAADLSKLAAGGYVAFTHYGNGHPVIGLHVMPGEAVPPPPERSPADRILAMLQNPGGKGIRFTPSEAARICDRILLYATLPE